MVFNKLNLLNTFSCKWQIAFCIYCLNFFMNQIIVKKVFKNQVKDFEITFTMY